MRSALTPSSGAWRAAALSVVVGGAVACGHIGIQLSEDGGDGPSLGGANGSGAAPSGGGGAQASGGATTTGGATASGGTATTGGDVGSGGVEAAAGGTAAGGTATGGTAAGDGGTGGTGGEAGVLPDCSTGAFSTPVLLSDLAVEGDKWGPSVTRDGLLLVFAVSTANGERLYQSLRPSRDAPFAAATELAGANQAENQGTPFINSDGTRIYFFVQDGPDQTSRDLWSASRGAEDEPFTTHQALAGVNSPGRDHLPWLSDDELTIFFTSSREEDAWLTDIWTATRPDISSPFNSAKSVSGLGGEAEDGSPSLTPDQLTLYFTSDRQDDFDVWSATRGSKSAQFSAPIREDALSGIGDELNLNLSPDGRDMYLSSDRSGTQELWVAVRECP